MSPNYVIPFPDFWDEEFTTFTEDGIIFISDLTPVPDVEIQIDSTGGEIQTVTPSDSTG